MEAGVLRHVADFSFSYQKHPCIKKLKTTVVQSIEEVKWPNTLHIVSLYISLINVTVPYSVHFHSEFLQLPLVQKEKCLNFWSW